MVMHFWGWRAALVFTKFQMITKDSVWRVLLNTYKFLVVLKNGVQISFKENSFLWEAVVQESWPTEVCQRLPSKLQEIKKQNLSWGMVRTEAKHSSSYVILQPSIAQPLRGQMSAVLSSSFLPLTMLSTAPVSSPQDFHFQWTLNTTIFLSWTQHSKLNPSPWHRWC